MANPFTEYSAQYYDFETLSDLEWHCAKCQLKSTQAKTWQNWRDMGYRFETDEKTGYYCKTFFCEKCGKKTTHRKLLSLEPDSSDIKTRAGIPAKIRKRAKELYSFTDAYTLRTESEKKLQVDHKKPRTRCEEPETIDANMSDAEIKEKFLLLTEENNLLKKNACETCKKTGKRAKGYKIIEFWYLGDEEYSESVGCCGCFWFDPYKWRAELNKKIKGE